MAAQDVVNRCLATLGCIQHSSTVGRYSLFAELPVGSRQDGLLRRSAVTKFRHPLGGYALQMAANAGLNWT
jgi:hypothetical protein